MRPLVPVAALLALLALTLAPAAQADGHGGPVEVGVGIYVINFGNYDANKGTYLLDFYFILKWDPAGAPANFSPEKFEFMNGRATAKDRIFDATDPGTGEREVWYRIQANLYSEPRFDRYPYDTQTVRVLFEDSVSTSADLVYVPLVDQSGLDSEFNAAGWRVHEPRFEAAAKEYGFGETYSRGEFSVELSRERFSTTIKALLPPMAFIIVSGLSFFLHPSKIAQRLGLGTSMLISAVMFHLSQTVGLPPLARLILFDKIMIAVYVFLVGSLIVTTFIAIDEDYWKDRDYTRPINRWGGIATLVLPLVVLALLMIP